MTPEQIEQERQAFEAWVRTFGDDELLEKCPGEYIPYKDMSIKYAWLGWAARADRASKTTLDWY